MHPDEYRKMAEVEERMWYYRALHRNIICSVKLRSNPVEVSLLDAGCGTGGLLYRFKQAYPEWRFTGLDFSSVACDRARKRTGGEIVEGSISTLPFPAAHFDVAVSCDVVCQISDAEKAVAEFFRCLKSGGIVVLNMPAYQWMYSYHDRETANLRRYTRTEVNALLTAAGFKIVRSTYWNMLPFPLAFIKRKILPSDSSKSDVKLLPPPVEAFFNGLMRLEQFWLSLGGRMPFGSSVLTVAQKP
jgi:SAM-dependent methyltransferase